MPQENLPKSASWTVGLSTTEKVNRLLSSMTIEEKISQLYSVWLEIREPGKFVLKSLQGGSAADKKEDPFEVMKNGIGQITRPLGTLPLEPKMAVRGLNEIQKFLIERTRLGIPALPHEECLAGLMADGATLFPAGINFGSLWDPHFLSKISAAIGEELYSVGSRQGLAPVLDVTRDVRWGRTEESLGEDPYLVGTMACAYVSGFQGPQRRLLATLKHFVGHSFSEGGRNHAPVHIGERELLDTFLLPFEMAVKIANAGSVMPAYHDIDGEPSSSSKNRITGILRDLWGFDGLVVSDYEALSQLYTDHRVAGDVAEAASLSIKAGMDMELPSATCFRTGVQKALERGILDVSEVTATVQRVLVEKLRLGLFDHPYTEEESICLNTPEHRSLASEAAVKSMVLLSNDGILPLATQGSVALIGPLADEPLAFFSGYSFPVHLITAARLVETPPPKIRTIRESLEKRLGAGAVATERGCDILTKRPIEAPVFPGDPALQNGQRKSYISSDESKIRRAVEVAAQSDRIVVVLGDLSGLFLSGTVGEGSDVSSLALPGVQQKLLDALIALGKPIVVVLVNGRPYHLGEAGKKINAVLEAWLPGQEGADAIVRVLCGDDNPGGKLPVSFPKTAGAMPYSYNHRFKSAGSPVQPDFGADYPFGHGLSYTRFAYEDFAVKNATAPIDGEFSLSLTIKNSGDRKGDEVVQLYVRDLLAEVVRPVMELKGFCRLTLLAGARATVSFRIPVDMLNYAVDGKTRVVEPGEFEILVGSSSADIRCRATVTVTGNRTILSKNWRMQSLVEVSS